MELFAIVSLGDKQYKVKSGEAFECEKIDLDVGNEFIFDKDKIVLVATPDDVLFGSDVSHYQIKCKVIKQFRDDKIIVFKKKRRKDYTRKRGHRQYKTILLVNSINKI